jgi:hypothetical protein
MGEKKIEEIKLNEVMRSLREKIKLAKLKKPLKFVKLSTRPEIKKA